MRKRIFFMLSILLIFVILSINVYAFELNQSLAPYGTIVGGTNSVQYDATNKIYNFSYVSGSEHIQYLINVSTGSNVSKGLLKIKAIVNDESAFYPVVEAGTQYRKGDKDSDLFSPWVFVTDPFYNLDSMNHNLENSVLILNYSEQYNTTIHNRTFHISIVNKSLVIEAFATDNNTNWYPNYAGFEFGRSADTPNPKEILLPYLHDVPVGLVDGSVFYSAYIDRSKSHSTGNLSKESCSGSDYTCISHTFSKLF